MLALLADDLLPIPEALPPPKFMLLPLLSPAQVLTSLLLLFSDIGLILSLLDKRLSIAVDALPAHPLCASLSGFMLPPTTLNRLCILLFAALSKLLSVQTFRYPDVQPVKRYLLFGSSLVMQLMLDPFGWQAFSTWQRLPSLTFQNRSFPSAPALTRVCPRASPIFLPFK